MMAWVTDGSTKKPFSITAIIPAGVKGRDDDMNQFIQNYTILDATHCYLTEILETKDPICGSNDSIEEMK